MTTPLKIIAENKSIAQTTGSSEFAVAGYLPVSLSDVVVGNKDLLVVQHQRNMSTNYWLATVSSWVYRPMDDGLLQFSVVGHPSTVTLMTALAPTQVYQVVRWLPRPEKVTSKWIEEHAAHMTFHYRDTDNQYIHPVFRYMNYWDTNDISNVVYYTSDPVREASFEPQTSAVSTESTLPPIPGASTTPTVPGSGGFKPQAGRFDTVSSSTFWGSTDNEEDNNV